MDVRRLFKLMFFSSFIIANTHLVSADIITTIGGINTLLYGIAAGIAVLMITIHAIKWKTASSPADREEAKRGIINVVLGLAVIIIAAALVTLIYSEPE